ncbi:MAG: hypothetical protein A2848_03080 [Candidatus Magasanikbacteria bacterium RIFCSPHIGHO2_01_FULL_50_8]|uniref:Uncharacterized protein n=1 Tax=Candidatus Magasanikbacteria bacterium RIFCSPHIGHO2_01_FULL_50_8 TaxID=1798674 RepID=A0A1F6LUC4_9BACT|nr:MAG: hypothetical protein A2848_03080 [Candidatus Magasanikbacteria bacterium RIFCSPHIGHO2_01_FULL_50_8]
MSAQTPIVFFATVEWHVTSNSRRAHISTDRPLADQWTREQLGLNGEPSRLDDPRVVARHRVALHPFLNAGSTELQLAVFCNFLRAIAEYLFNHATVPRDARKSFHYVRENRFILGHGQSMLAIDVMDDAFELNTIADRPIHIDTHHIRTHLHTEALITFLLQHSKDAIAAVTAVANASPDPTDALVQEALRLAGARDPVVVELRTHTP